jgi:hypothetical protein
MNLRTAFAATAVSLALAGGLAVPAQACTHHPDRNAAACAATVTWAHHRTATNLSRLVRAARPATPTVRTDVAVVATEWRQNDWYDLPADLNSLYVDACR